MNAVIKAIIFDCDGVLVDSEELKFRAWQTVLQPRGIVLSFEDYQLLAGQTGLSILRQIGKKHELSLDPQIVNEKNEIYWALQKHEITAIDPMVRTVNWVKERYSSQGLLLGVASSASRDEILFNLDYLKIKDLFHVILSGKEDLAKYNDPLGVNKPQPYIYLEMSHQLNVQPNECLVFEDSESGVRAAKSAGCKVIAIPNKWTLSQNFEMADLLLLDSNFEEITANIKRSLAH